MNKYIHMYCDYACVFVYEVHTLHVIILGHVY